MLAAGTRLGPYEVVAPLGKGGMGVVYRARDPRLGRDVAIKLIAAAHADDPGTKEQFFTEMRAVAALAHPNILNIFDIGEDAGVRYAVMELVTGYTLSDALRSGRLPPELALDIAAQIASALSAAHARGVIHLDLKPANVMVLDDGRVKLLDFGLARMDQPVVTDQSITRIVDGTSARPEAVAAATKDCSSVLRAVSPKDAEGAGTALASWCETGRSFLRRMTTRTRMAATAAMVATAYFQVLFATTGFANICSRSSAMSRASSAHCAHVARCDSTISRSTASRRNSVNAIKSS